MTIPWIDQPSLRVKNLPPVCCEPVNKGEKTPSNIAGSQPEYSDIHQERISSPPEYIKDLSWGITPAGDNPVSFPGICFIDDSSLNFCKPPIEGAGRGGSFIVRNLDSFLNSEKNYRRGFLCTPPFLADEIYKSNKSIFNPSEAEHFIRPRFTVKDFSRRSLAKLTLRLSLFVFLLCALDTGSVSHSRNNTSTQKVVVWSLFPHFCSIQNLRGSDFQKRIEQDKVWSDPRQDSRTVGKHRCHCTKNSFFVSLHNISENWSVLHPVEDQCKN